VVDLEILLNLMLFEIKLHLCVLTKSTQVFDYQSFFFVVVLYLFMFRK
jgi:hypothetical protein